MAFLTKYRPNNWDEVVGHDVVVDSIKAVMAQQDRPQAWLFAGGSGCGKTTIARILARHYGATSIGIVEINTADLRGIDAVRDIVGGSQYRIPGSPKSVYILDECHQLTDAAQNALLKALEDTPKHLVYVLCTTEPDKLLPTIRTRCREFVLSSVSRESIEELLLKVCEQEGILPTENTLDQIVVAAQGSPRLALNLLERARGVVDNQEKVAALLKSVVPLYSNEGDTKLARVVFGFLARDDKQELLQVFNRRRFTPDELNQLVRGLFAMIRLGLLKEPAPWMAQLAIELERTRITSEATLMGILWLNTSGLSVGRQPNGNQRRYGTAVGTRQGPLPEGLR